MLEQKELSLQPPYTQLRTPCLRVLSDRDLESNQRLWWKSSMGQDNRLREESGLCMQCDNGLLARFHRLLMVGFPLSCRRWLLGEMVCYKGYLLHLFDTKAFKRICWIKRRNFGFKWIKFDTGIYPRKNIFNGFYFSTIFFI